MLKLLAKVLLLVLVVIGFWWFWPDRVIEEQIKKEHQALVLWCREKDCFWLDREGVAIEQAPGMILGGELVTIEEESSVPINLESKVTTSEFIQFVQTIKQKIEARTFKLVAGQLTVLTNQGIKIFFDTTRSAKEQIEIFNHLPHEKIKDYVDLRLKDRVYYK